LRHLPVGFNRDLVGLAGGQDAHAGNRRAIGTHHDGKNRRVIGAHRNRFRSTGDFAMKSLVEGSKDVDGGRLRQDSPRLPRRHEYPGQRCSITPGGAGEIILARGVRHPHATPGRARPRRRAGFAIRFRPPLGKEIIKVIATTEPADFRGLLHLPPDASGKGPEEALSKASKGLGQLLNHARRDTKDPGPILFDADWATAEVAFEVVK
jgi:hypothetical protein